MYEPLIKHISQIISLNDEEIGLLKLYFKPQSIKKKQYLFEQGDIARYEYFILKGCLKTFSLNEAGEEHILSFAIENWWIGDLYSFWTGKPSNYSIMALEDCDLLLIDNENLEELYSKVPKMERYFRILIKNAYVTAQQRIIGTIGQTAEERYLEFIAKYPNLEQRIPQYMLAAYLGITPEFLSKIRRRLVYK